MTHLFHGQEVRLGKLAPKVDDRTLQFVKYATAALPSPPPIFALGGKVANLGMFLNDRLGDCTIAAAAHMEEVWTSWTQLWTPTDAQAGAFYWRTGDPPSTTGTAGGPTDTGRVEIDVLNSWRDVGFDGQGGHKIWGYTEVNVQNLQETRTATWLFGGLYIGIALPITAQSQHVWDVVPNSGENGQPGSWGGHAVNVVEYDAKGPTIITWGKRLKMTWAFWAKYVDEAYAVLSPDWAEASSTLKDPTGFLFSQLESDLSAF